MADTGPLFNAELATTLDRCAVAGVLPTWLAILLTTLPDCPIGARLAPRPRLLLGLTPLTLALTGGLLSVAIPIRLGSRLLLGLTPLTLALAASLLPAAVAIGLRLRLLFSLTLLTLALAGGLLLGAVRLRLCLIGLAPPRFTPVGFALTALALRALPFVLTLGHSLPRLAFTTTALCAAWRPLILNRAFLLTTAARHLLRGCKHEPAQDRRCSGTDEYLTSHGDGSSLSSRCFGTGCLAVRPGFRAIETSEPKIMFQNPRA